jgi:hypothetical protein
VVIDEVLPKRMFVLDQVVTQRVAADGRPNSFAGIFVYMLP